MIGLKAKLWAALAAMGGVLMTVIYWVGRKDANFKNKVKRAENTVDALKHKEEVREDVKNKNDDGLIAGASKPK